MSGRGSAPAARAPTSGSLKSRCSATDEDEQARRSPLHVPAGVSGFTARITRSPSPCQGLTRDQSHPARHYVGKRRTTSRSQLLRNACRHANALIDCSKGRDCLHRQRLFRQAAVGGTSIGDLPTRLARLPGRVTPKGSRRLSFSMGSSVIRMSLRTVLAFYGARY